MLHKYTQFINENFYDDFKSKYFKLFNDSDDDIKNQLGELFKKIDDETNDLKIVNIFDDFLSINQKLLNDKISNSTTNDVINTLLGDNLKAIFFALKSVKLKLNDKDFSNTFEKSKDKNFQNLMAMKMAKFSDAVETYINSYMIPQIEKLAGVEKSTQESKIYEQDIVLPPTETQPQPQAQPQAQSDKLETYKDESIEWFNYIYGMTWKKLKDVKARLSSNTNSLTILDQLSNSMKNSNNDEAKKQLLKKIISLPKEDLNTLGEYLNLNLKEFGEF